MEKYQNMYNNEGLLSKAMIIEFGEMKVKSQLRETAEYALARGIAETMIQNV